MPPERVPLLDLEPELAGLHAELTAAVEGVLSRRQFVLGPELERLEQEAALWLGVRHTVGLNSGTDALILALLALGVRPGDEVITTPFTFVATAESIARIGAVPVFCDIDARSFNLDPTELESKLTARTRAVVPVHVFGHPVDMDPLLAITRRHRLAVVEDAAQAFGATYRGRKTGGLGDAAAFSFYPSKNLGACGDGGLLATDDDEVAARVRLLRNHGARHREPPQLLGFNSRLDEIQAAILRVKLPHVEGWNQERRRVAGLYTQRLAPLADVRPPDEAVGTRHVYHQYTVRIAGGRRDAVAKALADQGIQTAVYYRDPLHRNRLFADPVRELPRTDAAAGEVLSLPFGPHLLLETLDRIVDALTAALR